MSKYVARICTVVLVSAVPVFCCQTALAAEKAKKTDTPTAGADKSLTSQAGIINTNFSKRIHAKIDKQVEPDFLRLVGARRNAADVVRVLKQLFREKQAVLEKIGGSLAEDYKILKDHNYRYDEATKTIFHISRTNKKGTNATDQASAESVGNKSVHMVLDTKEKADKFAQLSGARQIVTIEVQVLARLEREKAADLKRLDGILLEKFSMSRDRRYEYDGKTGTLYELIPMPTAAGKEAKKK